ncbi:hypothetical protein NW766_005742 [Fusarium irregulare]|uniref:Amidase domain-containing protein n=1 Tax=Fusarium irregulare TaxID=2494466 RepID=A0A9W8PSN4_9HYPO|nr:hypothetical protein NW766_005742 [Fusarium irregulare]
MLANFDCTDLAILDAQGGIDARVAVPSRCYFNPTKDRPLEGARIAFKDNFDVAGHKTTLCNRAWENLYPPAEKHAACVQKMIDGGAIIVGKVKMQAMDMREEPLGCVEFSTPFNPRGDGHQGPSGSSHASSASVASYEWLDYSFGSDTNGVGRMSAQHSGCFSIRPTACTTNNAGVIGHFE